LEPSQPDALKLVSGQVNAALNSRVVPVLLLSLALATPKLVGQQPSADDQRQTAIALEQQGKTAESEAAWRAVVKAEPNSAEAYAHLGFLEARQEHYKQAIVSYRKAKALNPSMPALDMNLGLALFKAGDLKEAVQIFNRILKDQSPGSNEALRLKTLIGMADYGMQEHTAAIPYLKEATAADPQNLPFRLMLAHSCLAAKQYQCVLDTYHEILNLNAESAEADMLAGEALDETQDHAGAIQQFRAAVKANPKEPNVHFGLGYLLWRQGQFADAADEFQAELANVPDHAQAMVYLADSRIKMNQPEVALPLLRKAVQINSGIDMAHLDLGIIYSDTGRHVDALRELKLAAKINPGNVNVHWRLAQLYRGMGRKEEAAAEFEKTKTLTKAADESVSSKLKNSPAQQVPPRATTE
jgi:tetratricopeptide (TPR) repeat protein